MGNRPKKKARFEAKQHPAQPLGSQPALNDESTKDDEERLLESQLFGKAFKPSTSKFIINLDDGESELPGVFDDGDNELGQIPDADLFVLDAGAPSEESFYAAAGVEQGDIADASSVVKGSDEEESSLSTAPTPKVHDKAQDTRNPGRRKAAWTDPDDSSLRISLTSEKRLRKLRDEPSEDTIGGIQYEAKLRREFQKLNPAPEWAAKSRSKRRKAENEGTGSDPEGVDISNLLSSTNGIVDSEARSSALPKGTLQVERLRDANQLARAEGEIKSMSFHPSPKVPVMLTAGTDRRLRLFNVDGHTNPHMQTIHIPELPVTNAVFHPDGSSVLLTGPRPFYYTYDLQSGMTTRSPRGLWGTTFTNSDPSKLSDMSMDINAFDSSGEILAVAGRQGYVHLVDWKSGGGQVVGSLKMNSPIKSLCWSRASGRAQLSTLGQDAEVYVWDVGERRCLRRWKDDDGFGSSVLASDHNDRYVSVGSKTGIVNVYDSESTSILGGPTSPKPLKVLGNLTTAVSTVHFNRDSQLMAIASYAKKDQLRLIHLPSLTAFSNWPTSGTPLGHVTAIDFSPTSEYMAISNNRGRVLLYHLSHFCNR